MTDERQDLGHDDPAGGHDPEALRQAAERMHVVKSRSGQGAPERDDPDGGHDVAALDDAAAKMHSTKD